MPASTRDRILDSATYLMQRDGYAATGLKAVVTAAGAPFGSLYHFFPGGKVQLGQEVLERGGRAYQQLVEAVLDTDPDLATSLGIAFEGAAQTLIDTDFADACPVATMALETCTSNDALRQSAATVFRGWISALQRRLTAAGVPAELARPLAGQILSLLEGAFVLSQTLRDPGPVRAAGRAAVALFVAARDRPIAPTSDPGNLVGGEPRRPSGRNH